MPKPQPPTLSELQRSFAAVLVDDPGCVLQPWIAARGINPQARLRIYRNAGYAIHVEALEAVFPVTRAFVGEESFDGLATRYTARVGSRSGNLQVFGDAFPDFLRMQPETAAWPWLGDVAQLEALRQQCLVAADGEPAPDTSLQLPSGSGGDTLFLHLQPHVRALVARSPVFDLWRYGRTPDSCPQPDPGGDAQSVLLWREGHALRTIAVHQAQAAFAAALCRGRDVSQALAASGAGSDAEDLAHVMQPLLEHALICALDSPPPDEVSSS